MRQCGVGPWELNRSSRFRPKVEGVRGSHPTETCHRLDGLLDVTWTYSSPWGVLIPNRIRKTSGFWIEPRLRGSWESVAINKLVSVEPKETPNFPLSLIKVVWKSSFQRYPEMTEVLLQNGRPNLTGPDWTWPVGRVVMEDCDVGEVNFTRWVAGVGVDREGRNVHDERRGPMERDKRKLSF